MKIPFISIFMMTEQLKLELNANIKIIITLISIFNELDNWNYSTDRLTPTHFPLCRYRARLM